MLDNLVSGLVNTLMSPLKHMFISFVYGVLVRGPLKILNTLDHVFQFVSGSKVDKMLFDTSIVDGKPHLNFFTSNSPLKHYFLVMLAVAGVLLAIFIGFVVLSTLSKKQGSNPVKAVGKVLLTSTIVFIIPLIFLIVLSLSGSVLQTLEGKQQDMGSKSIASYRDKTSQEINRIENIYSSAPNIYESSTKGVSGMKDENGNPTSYSLEEIYTNFSKAPFFDPTNFPEKYAQQATTSQEAFKAFRKSIIDFTNHQVNQDLEESLDQVQGIIPKLKPQYKNEEESDEVKALQDKLQTIIELKDSFISTSEDLLSDLDPNNINDRYAYSLNNFKIYFEYMLGTKVPASGVSQISSLRDLDYVVDSIINGDPGDVNSGLLGLRTTLSSFTDNTLTTVFYHVSTGNRDNNWDRDISSMKNSSFMILMGFFLICGAGIIMIMSVLFAITRIFDLGLLFILSPAIIFSSGFDDGKRMKTWAELVIAKLISVFGIIISLRVFGMLNIQFMKAISSSSISAGATGYLISNMATGLFGLGGMLAAYKSSQTISSIVGAGSGIMGGMQGRETLGILKAAGGATIKAAVGVGAVGIGMKKVGKYAKSAGASKIRDMKNMKVMRQRLKLEAIEKRTGKVDEAYKKDDPKLLKLMKDMEASKTKPQPPNPKGGK